MGVVTSEPLYLFWLPWGAITNALPWILMVSLMFLPRNRTYKAYLSLFPLIVSLILAWWITSSLPVLEPHYTLLKGTAFGLCAAWLVAPYLQQRSFWRNCFGLALVLMFVILVTLCHELLFIEGERWNESLFLVGSQVLAVFIAFGTSFVYCLSARLSKNYYHRSRCFVYILVLTPVVWGISTILLLDLDLFRVDTFQYTINLIPALFLVQLPFLLMSLANDDQGLRLESMAGRSLEKKQQLRVVD